MKNYLFTLILLVAMATGTQAVAALSATVTLSPSTAIINQPVAVNVVISNTGASQLTVNNVQITASSTGAAPGTSKIPAAFSVFNVGPNNVPFVLPANLTTTITAGSAIFFAPSTGITGSGTGTYSVGATLYTSDGSVTGANVAGIATINPVPLPAAERQ